MDREKLTALEPFFDGWHLDNIIDQTESRTLYRVMKTSPDGSVGFRHLCVTEINADPPHSDGEFPEEVQMKLLPLDIMKKMKNCDSVVSYYDSRAIYNGNGEYAVLSLFEAVKPLSEEYDIHELPVSSALKIVIAACEAVGQFRSMGITHENISLDNIFIGGSGDFKLGIFSAAGSNNDCKAPEEYSKNSDLSQTDMYALGMLLFKALHSGRAPFLPEYPIEITEENISNAVQRRLGGEIPSAPDGAPTGVDKIIKKACAFKPSNRYQNLSSIKRDVEAVLSDIDPTYSPRSNVATGYAFGQAVPKAQREQLTDDSEDIIDDDAPIGYCYDGDGYYNNDHEESGKTIKILIAAIVTVAIISVALIVYSIRSTNEQPTTTAPTTTTQPIMTQPTTTEPTTTEPTTTEPTTTEPTTTEPTIPQTVDDTSKPEVSTTIVTTTQPTTKPTTTEPPTTEPTTTEPPAPEYIEIADSELELIENDGRVEEILVFAGATFGSEVSTDGEALLYAYDEDGTIVKTHPVSIECYYDKDHPEKTICDMLIPSDIEINTDEYQYELFIPKDTIQGSDSKNEAFSIEF